MTTVDRFYGVKPDHDIQSVLKALDKGQITQEDADILSRFVADMRVTRNVTHRRVLKLISTLVGWRRYIGPFLDVTIPELYRGIERLKNAKSDRGTPFTEQTLYDFITIIKQFFRWSNEEGFTDIDEKKLSRIKNPVRASTKTHNDLFTPQEVIKMLESCRNSEDRALISTLYEGGFRIGEIAELTWHDLRFDGTGVAINVMFKTKKPRHIRLVMAMEHLIRWRGDYPGTPEGENLVFVNKKGEPFIYEALVKRLRSVGKYASITKHITPHVFRHSRITHLIQQGGSESVIKLMMWGDINTPMFRTYAHLTGTDIDREVYRLNGVKMAAQMEENQGVGPRICSGCNEPNSPISKYCHRCGNALVADAQMPSTQLQEFIMAHADELIDFITAERAREAAGNLA